MSKISLRTLLILPFVLQVLGITGLVGYLSYRSGRQAVADLANQLIGETGKRVDQSLTAYLELPGFVTRNNVQLLQRGQLDGFDLPTLEQYFVGQMQFLPRLSSVAIANETGEFLSVERPHANELIIRRLDAADPENRFFRYRGDGEGQNLTLQEVRTNFNPRQDPPDNPWYAEAKAHKAGIWRLAVTLSQGQDQPILHLARFVPFYDADGQFQGIAAASIYLTQLGEFLQSLDIGRQGQVFLVDSQGLLVATSTGEVPFDRQADADHAQNVAVRHRRLLATDSTHPLTQAVAEHLAETTSPSATSSQPYAATLQLDGQRYFLRHIPVSQDLDWQIVVVVPEADFMPVIQANLQRTIGLCVLALLGTMALGLWLAKRISHPVVLLSQATQAFAAGQAQLPMPSSLIREIEDLRTAFEQLQLQRRQAAQSQAIFQESTDALFLVQAETRLTVDCNQQAADMFEVASPQDLIGIKGHTLQKYAYSPAELVEIKEQLDASGFWRQELEYVTQQGHTFWGLISAKPLTINAQSYYLVRVTDISDRKRAEIALQKTNSEIQAFLDNAPAAISLFDAAGRYLRVNPVCASHLGISIADIVGKTFSDFFPDNVVQTFRQRLQQLIETRRPLVVEDELWLGNSHKVFQSILFPVLEGQGEPRTFWAFATDISDRKQFEVERQRTEELLRHSETRLRLITDSIPGCIAYIDANQCYRFVNRTYEDWFDCKREDVIGKTVEAIIGEAAYARTRGYIEQVLAGETLAYEAEIPYQNGPTRHITAVLVPDTQEDEAVLGYYALITDITARKNTEFQLQQAKKAAESANEAKSRFITNVSHELRSPLNAILGFARVLQADPTLSADQQEHANIIESSGSHLLSIINQVLDLAKLEAHSLSLTITTINLQHFLNHLQGLFSLKAGAQHLDFKIEATNPLPTHLQTDEMKLRQVLINLLDNAFKFTQQGSVTLRVKALPQPSPENLHLQFEVQDTGPGIAIAEQASLFEAFSQAQLGQATQSGTGLGLTISREFVRLMGGNLSLESDLGQGSLFRFDILARSVSDPPVNRSRTATPRVIGLQPDHPPYRLLIVDDSATNRRLLVRVLEVLGAELREAENGAEALELWANWQPHLILMDLRMPVMDGYSATRQIRQQEDIQGLADTTVIIAVSATGSDEFKQSILEVGFNDFIAKPFQRAQIFDSLQQHLHLTYVYSSPEE